jgi:hypothetical protein
MLILFIGVNASISIAQSSWAYAGGNGINRSRKLPEEYARMPQATSMLQEHLAIR